MNERLLCYVCRCCLYPYISTCIIYFCSAQLIQNKVDTTSVFVLSVDLRLCAGFHFLGVLLHQKFGAFIARPGFDLPPSSPLFFHDLRYTLPAFMRRPVDFLACLTNQQTKQLLVRVVVEPESLLFRTIAVKTE